MNSYNTGPLRSMSMGQSQSTKGSTYSVKYLGIVDGAMGILSRKMALQGNAKESIGGAHDTVKVNSKIIAEQNNRKHQKDIQIKTYNSLRPVLGKKYEQYARQVNNNSYTAERVHSQIGQTVMIVEDQTNQTSFKNISNAMVVTSDNRGVAMTNTDASPDQTQQIIKVQNSGSGLLNGSTVTVQVESKKAHNSQVDLGDNNSLRMSGQNIISGDYPYSSAEMLAAHNDVNQMNYMAMVSQMSDERVSGYPQPELYDQHYINRYAYPKGLKTCGRRDQDAAQKRSLYDMRVPQNRKGFSGWKLTKRPQEVQQMEMEGLGLNGTGFDRPKKGGKRYNKDPYMSSNVYQLGPDENNINQTLQNFSNYQNSQENLNYGASKLGENITNIEVKNPVEQM